MPLSSVFGAIGSALQADSAANQVKAQREENEKNRQYNLNLAKLQNKWNMEQWQRETAYNSPKATMERFAAAGLNPNLIYGQTNNAPSLAGSMTSGSPSSPADLSAMALQGQAISNGFNSLGSLYTNVMAQRAASENIKKMRAETANISASTGKTEKETEILASDAKFRDAINQGQLDFNSMQIKNIKEGIVKSSYERGKIRQEIANLRTSNKNLLAEYDRIRSEISNIDADTAYKRVRMVLESKETEANVRKLAASARLDMATTRSVVSKLTYELLGLKTQAQLTQQEIANLQKLGIMYDVETNQMEFDLSQAVNFDDAIKRTGIWNDICQSLLPAAVVIGTALNGRGPKSVRGFR